MRIAFTTFGCKINQYETDSLRRELSEKGNSVVSFDDEADVYVINTCSVTARSDYQCRQAIRSAVRRGHGAKVVVTGCYAETRPDELRKIPGVNLVIGNLEKSTIPLHLATWDIAEKIPSSFSSMDRDASSLRQRTRGFLKIQDGCDNKCSYCIVPDARGASRSVGRAEVVGEFDRLVGSGCPEVVLSGIHIGKYGQDLQQRVTLTELLKDLITRRRKTRIRLSSIEPREITPGMLELFNHGLCRHLHIPLQSGDDAVLSAMRRDYTAAFYQELLEDIASKVPGIALGADVMVGFPGEGEREFQNTLKLVEGSRLTHLHVFSYSPRPGTPAALMKPQVPEQVKKERSEALRELGRKKNHDFRKRFIGSELRIVLEDAKEADNGALTGLTDNYIRVAVSGPKLNNAGPEVPVTITDAMENQTLGVSQLSS